jgi:hypothetical protein
LDFGTLAKFIDIVTALAIGTFVKLILIPICKKLWPDLQGVATVRLAAVMAIVVTAGVMPFLKPATGAADYIGIVLTALVAVATAIGLDVLHNASGIAGGDKAKV